MRVLSLSQRGPTQFPGEPAAAELSLQHDVKGPERDMQAEHRRHTFLGLAAVLALGLVVFGLAAALGFVACTPGTT